MRILRRLSATFLTMLLLFNATACQLPQGLMPGFNTSNSEEAEPSHDHTHDHSSEVHEHTFYSHWTYDNSFHWHDASCDHNVRDSYTTHTFSDWKILVEPSETFNGVKERSCKVCNYTVRENIPMSTHTHKPIEGTYLRIEPNCVTYGLIEYDCACGEHIKETLPMLDHNKVYNYECKEDSHIAYIKCAVCDYNEIIEEPHQFEEKIIYEATEYDDGLKIVYCYICGYEKEERIPSFNHKHDYEYYVIKVDPTCQNEGYTRHNCICGDYYDSDIIEKQHSYYSYYDYTPDNHWLSYHCNYCDDKYMDMEESHKFEMSVVREPTEKKDGIYRYSCICGYEYDEIIPSAICEHDYFPEFNWSNNNGQVELEIKFFCTKNPNHILEDVVYDYGYQLWAWVSEPTCVSEGIATYRGEVVYNGITYYDYKDFELPADPSYHHYEETFVPPTCEEKGYNIYTCIDCGYSYRDNYVPETGHNFNTQYDHDEINYEHWFVDTCYECGYSQIRDKIMHQFVEEVIISPTEESDGLARYTCYCGHSYEEVLPMLNHTHDYQPIFTWYPRFAPELDVRFVCSKDPSHILARGEYAYSFDVLEFIKPNCIAEGYISYHGYTTYNGVTYTEDASFILPVDGAAHSYTMNHVEPTCQSYGYDEYICDFCKDYYTSNLVSPLGHDYSVTVSYDEYEHYDVCDCQRCGWQIIENRTTHNFDIANYYDDNYHWFTQDCYDCDYYFESEHESHNITHTVYSNPTEDTDGSYLDECNGCDYEFHGIIPSLGHIHSYDNIQVVEATCEQQGYTIYTCRCGDYYFDNFVSVKPHNFETQYGHDDINFEHWFVDICYDCGYSQIRDKIMHQFVEEVIVSPTEESEGLVRYTCYCEYSYEEVLPMLNHTHDYQPIFNWYNEFTPGVEVMFVCSKDSSHILDYSEFTYGFDILSYIFPTCVAEGYVSYHGYATYNGVTYTEDASFALPADESNHDYNYETIVVEPTCEVPGYTIHRCICGLEYTDNYIDALGHDYQAIFTWYPNWAPLMEATLICNHDSSHQVQTWELMTGWETLERIDPTCDGEGYEKVKGYVTYGDLYFEEEFSYALAPLGHSYNSFIDYDEHYHWERFACVVCGLVYDSNFSSHEFTCYMEQEATEEVEGLNRHECYHCDYMYYEIIPALGHTHDYYYIVESFDASCEMDGYTRYTCICGDFYDSDFVPMYGHNYQTTMNYNEFEHYYYDVCLNCFDYQNRDYLPHEFSYNVEVTPTEYYPGLGRYTCYCGYEYSEEIPMLGHTHDYNYDLDTILPTCEQQGYTIYTCSCGDFYIDNYIDALGHDIVYTPALEATCESEGYTEGNYCDRCMQVFSYPVVTPALGHDYVAVYSFFPNTDDLVDIDLVCQNDRSHLVKEEQMDVGWYAIEKIEPTCKESGFEKVIAYADYNGMHFETEYSYYPNPLDHNYYIYERVEPNCVSYGYERYYCSCGDFIETILDPIPATGHNLTEIFEYNENYHYSVLVCLNEGCDFRHEGSYISHNLTENIINYPTCEGSGLAYVYCSECEYNDHVAVSPYGHDYQAYFTWFLAEDIPFEVYLQCNRDSSHIVSGWEMEIDWSILQQVDPTCTTEGYIDVYGYARYDGVLYEKYDTYVLTTSGHNYEYNVEVVEATCEENGYTRYTCVCGDYFDSDYVYAAGHNNVDGYCSVCGILVPSEGLEYSFNGIEYALSGLGTCKDSKVVIPEYYNGYPVTSILRGAIHTDNYDTSFINEIILPSTLVTIESSAISASNMRHIMVPESVINYEWDSIYVYSSWPPNTIICFEGKAPESVYGLYIENTARDYVKEVIYENNKQYIITKENYAILSRIYDGDTSIPSEINGYPVTTLGSYVFTNSSITSINLLDYNFTTLEGMCLDGLHYAGIKGTENFEDKLGFGLIKENGYCDEVIVTVQENSIPSDWGRYALGYPSEWSNPIKVVCNATLDDLVELDDGTIYAYCNGKYVLVSYDFGEFADLTQELVLSDGTVLFDYCVAEGMFNCNSQVKNIVLNNTIEVITENMFEGNVNLESVVISPSVTKIESFAFEYMQKLTSISFESQCNLLEIGEYAFYECTNLTSADIFTDIINIGSYAFYHTGITYFRPSYDIEYIGEYAFAKSRLVEVQFGLQDSLREIGKYAFANCYDMQYFHMADLSTLEVIPEYMCYYNSALISVILPDSVIEIGMYAFGNCSNITRLDISSNLVTMGYGVFSALKGLEGLVLPSSLDASLLFGNEFGTNGIFKIDGPVNLELYDKFASCHNVVCFTDSDYDRAYDAGFEFIVYDDSAIIVSYPQGSKEDYFLTIPDIVEHNGKTYTVKYINPYMFLDYCNFSSVKIPDGIIYIGREAFYNNSSLTNVTLPSSLKYISRCFNNVSEITIPDNIEYMSDIGSYEVTYHISSTFDKDISSIIDQQYNKINYVIDGDNERFKLIDGVLVDVELKKIVSGCKSNNIPEGYTTIGDSAYSCLSFSEVIIPEGVEKIDYYAFYGCYNIDKVVIPSTIKEIHTQAFEMALFNENLQIIFNGTKDDFVTIFSEGINNVEYESFWLSYLYCYGMDDYTNVSCNDGILTLKMRGV